MFEKFLIDSEKGQFFLDKNVMQIIILKGRRISDLFAISVAASFRQILFPPFLNQFLRLLRLAM